MGELFRRRILNPFEPRGRGPIPVAFFDADKTLRISKSGSPSANGAEDVLLLPGAVEGIRRANRKGYFVALVTNQAGIPRFVSMDNADKALRYTVALLADRDAVVHYYDFAEKRDEDRKPEIGMALRLERTLQKEFKRGIDRSRSFMVGDAAYETTERKPDGTPGQDFSHSDRKFAENFGIEFQDVATYLGWKKKFGLERFDSAAQVKATTKKVATVPSSRRKKVVHKERRTSV